MSEKISKLIFWLKIYNFFLAFLYLASFACLLVFSFMEAIGNYQDRDFLLSAICFSLFFMFILILGIIFFYGGLKAGVRSEKNWIFQVILVALGIGSLLTMIPSIYLLIQLTSREVQDYYKPAKH